MLLRTNPVCFDLVYRGENSPIRKTMGVNEAGNGKGRIPVEWPSKSYTANIINSSREGQASRDQMTKSSGSNGKFHKFNIHVSIENMDEQQAIDYLHVLFRHAGVRDVEIIPDRPDGISEGAENAEASKQHHEEDRNKERIRGWMASGRLIWLVVNRNSEARGRIPCRILNYDESRRLLTIYHVDEKKVYTYKLDEVEDFIE